MADPNRPVDFAVDFHTRVSQQTRSTLEMKASVL